MPEAALQAIAGTVSAALDVLEDERMPASLRADLVRIRDSTGEAIAALVRRGGEKEATADVARNLAAIMTAADDADRALNRRDEATCARIADAFAAMRVAVTVALDATTRLKP